MSNTCIICGNDDFDAVRLFHFPLNREKLKLWEESLGVSLHPISKRKKICNFHFSDDCFQPFRVDLKLKPDALPSRWCTKPAQSKGDDSMLGNGSVTGRVSERNGDGRIVSHAPQGRGEQISRPPVLKPTESTENCPTPGENPGNARQGVQTSSVPALKPTSPPENCPVTPGKTAKNGVSQNTGERISCVSALKPFSPLENRPVTPGKTVKNAVQGVSQNIGGRISCVSDSIPISPLENCPVTPAKTLKNARQGISQYTGGQISCVSDSKPISPLENCPVTPGKTLKNARQGVSRNTGGRISCVSDSKLISPLENCPVTPGKTLKNARQGVSQNTGGRISCVLDSKLISPLGNCPVAPGKTLKNAHQGVSQNTGGQISCVSDSKLISPLENCPATPGKTLKNARQGVSQNTGGRISCVSDSKLISPLENCPVTTGKTLKNARQGVSQNTGGRISCVLDSKLISPLENCPVTPGKTLKNACQRVSQNSGGQKSCVPASNSTSPPENCSVNITPMKILNFTATTTTLQGRVSQNAGERISCLSASKLIGPAENRPVPLCSGAIPIGLPENRPVPLCSPSKPIGLPENRPVPLCSAAKPSGLAENRPMPLCSASKPIGLPENRPVPLCSASKPIGLPENRPVPLCSAPRVFSKSGLAPLSSPRPSGKIQIDASQGRASVLQNTEEQISPKPENRPASQWFTLRVLGDYINVSGLLTPEDRVSQNAFCLPSPKPTTGLPESHPASPLWSRPCVSIAGEQLEPQMEEQPIFPDIKDEVEIDVALLRSDVNSIKDPLEISKKEKRPRPKLKWKKNRELVDGNQVFEVKSIDEIEYQGISEETLSRGITKDEYVNCSDVCRACLFPENEMIDIKDVSFGELSGRDVFQNYTSITLDDQDGFPQKLCTICLYELCRAYLFINCCKKSDAALKELATSQDDELSHDTLVDTENNLANIGEHNNPEDLLKMGPRKVLESGPPFVCRNCSEMFDTLEALQAHKAQYKHYKLRRYLCKICNPSKIVGHVQWTSHMRKHLGKKPYKCTVCERAFAFESNKNKHVLTHSALRPVSCDVCNKPFSHITQVKLHKLKSHNGQKKKPPEQAQCDKCGKMCSSRHALHYHKVSHEAKRFLCSECGRSFHYRSHLTLHMNHHRGNHPYKCSYCEKTFGQKVLLKQHTRTHTGEKPYGCEHCDRKFSQTSHLVSHRRTHTGEKPYSCRFCDRRFALNGNLQDHIIKHIGGEGRKRRKRHAGDKETSKRHAGNKET